MSGQIFVTGDIHGSAGVYRFTHSGIFVGGKPNKGDVVLVAGDWSMPFIDPKIDDEALDKFAAFPWIFAFIDGNHENFPRLYSYPEEEHFGGPVGVLRANIFHLKRRGHVYNINGKSFWCFGGACSHDKIGRVKGVSWWPEEEPTDTEKEYGIAQLAKYGHVDYMLTHDCPFSLCEMNPRLFKSHTVIPSNSNLYLDAAAKAGRADLWIFGHHHIDMDIQDADPYPNRKFKAVYREIIRLQ